MTDRSRKLVAAQLTSAALLGALGQFVVGSADTYFGPPGELTRIGMVYLLGLASLLAVCLWGLSRDAPWTRPATVMVPALNIVAFVQPLVGEPLVAGAILLWNLTLLGRLLFPDAGSPARQLAAGAAPSPSTVGGPASRHLLLASTATAIVVVGFEQAARLPVHAVCIAFAAIALGSSARFLKHELAGGARWPWLALALAGAAVVTIGNPFTALILASAAQLLVLLRSWARDTGFAELLHAFYEHPGLLVLVSFLGAIALGTLLLAFPAASATGSSIGVVDAAFTATSAVCVTGLIVLDTPHAFTAFGHAVILLLIQVGGLNIMVLSTFGALLLGRGLGLKGEKALSEVLDIQTPETAYRLIIFVVTATLATELVGAAILGLAYRQAGSGPLQAAWLGLFHAVSAFCNAGFALHSDSLVGFREQPVVLLTVASLITLGGMGFVVLSRALPWTRTRGLTALRVHTRIVLVASAVLVIAGTIAFAIGEWNRSLGGLGPPDKLVNALFQSVTLRTAGFNSVPFDALGPATVLWMMVLMFIGASPGGTGGGIKTTTTVVLLAAVPAILRGRDRAIIAGRTLARDSLYRSTAIATVALIVLASGAALLLASQRGEFEQIVFEAVSAVGTVGLSLGTTPLLDSFGKIVIMALMLVGRIGPLTLALLLGRRLSRHVEYPQARILLG